MAYQTIKLTKHSDNIIERDAHAAIIPGALVELNADDEVLSHDTEGGNAVPIMFALENTLEGKGIDDDYAAGAKVQVWIPNRGDIVYALIADEETCGIGEFLESSGTGGSLHVHVGDVGDSTTVTTQNAIIGVALEAITAGAYGSGSESSATGDYHNPRIKVMIV